VTVTEALISVKNSIAAMMQSSPIVAADDVMAAGAELAPADSGTMTSSGPFAGARSLMATDLPSAGEGQLQAVDDVADALVWNYMMGPRNLPMVGYVHSPNCGFTMNVTVSALIVDRERVERKAMQYSMLVRSTCERTRLA
jgi:hypothetical protein